MGSIEMAEPEENRGQKLNVVVLTPTEHDGAGGIARLMAVIHDQLSQSAPPDLNVEFVVTRGVGRATAPLTFVRALLQVRALARSGRCDVVHINLASYGSAYRKLVFGRLCETLRIPYIIHLHGGLFDQFWSSRTVFVRRQINRFFDHAATIIVLGRVWADLVCKKVPSAESRIMVLPNATPSASLVPSDRVANSTHIVFLGKLCPPKGIPELIQALVAIKDLGSWHATLAGDGDVIGVRADIERLGLQERVAIPGWVEGKGAQDLMQSADILVLPSHIENMPLSIVEAFAHGLAVVSTPVGSIPEIIENERTGLLVPVGDISSLASAIRRLITDPAFRSQLGNAARIEHRIRFDLSGYMDCLIRSWRIAAQ